MRVGAEGGEGVEDGDDRDDRDDGCGDGFVMTATLTGAGTTVKRARRPVCPDMSLTRLRADD